jgi:selenocysteine-specific elongation factor
VDHGKSALVKALTGTDPDRLPEEKARGITIDLGFAHLELPHRQRSSHDPAILYLALVDVPGHEDFVKNMVAGVGAVDVALFVVAADDGWMPQSEEHLQILTYLGVTRAVVALTKIDLASDENAVRHAVRARLAGSPFDAAPIVATSVHDGRGIEALKLALVQVLAETPSPRDTGKPRLPIDRVFTLRGIGTVVTGALSGGVLRRGQAVIIQPSGRATRIRTLHAHNREIETSPPGTRTGLNLPDVDAHTGAARGDVITIAELGNASASADVQLVKSGRLAGLETSAARPLKDGTRVRVHLGSGHVAASIRFLSGEHPLLTGEQVLARLHFERPLFAFAGDYFVVRDWPEQITLAGGVVLDPDSDGRPWRDPSRVGRLRRRAQAPADPEVWVATEIEERRVVPVGQVLLKSRFSAQEIADAVARLEALGSVVVAQGLAMDAALWKDWKRRAFAAIDQHHRTYPEQAGFPLNDLRALLGKDPIVTQVFGALIEALCREGHRKCGATIQRTDHQPALPPALQAQGERIRRELLLKPMEPPSRKQLAPDVPSQQALRFLVQCGEAVELGPDVVLAGSSWTTAVEKIREHLRRHGRATAGELRQELGTTRRLLIPLLERLDRDGITRREGDWRVLAGR